MKTQESLSLGRRTKGNLARCFHYYLQILKNIGGKAKQFPISGALIFRKQHFFKLQAFSYTNSIAAKERDC